MRIKIKSFLLIITVLSITVSLTGCQNSSNSSKSTSSTNTKSAQEAGAFYYADQSSGSIEIKEAVTKTVAKRSNLFKTDDAEAADNSSGETILKIPSTGKSLKILPDGRFIYIANINEKGSGTNVSVFDAKTNKVAVVYEPKDGFAIDDFVLSPKGNLIATWDVKLSEKGKLLGGQSRVIQVDLSTYHSKTLVASQSLNGNFSSENLSLMQFILDPSVCLQYPIFYDVNNNVFLDTFCPNAVEGFGWGGGISYVDQNTLKIVSYEPLKIGSYSYMPTISSDGKTAVVVSPTEPLVATRKASDFAQKNPDEIYLLDLTTGEKTLVFKDLNSFVSAAPLISNDGQYIGATIKNKQNNEYYTLSINVKNKTSVQIKADAKFRASNFTNSGMMLMVHYTDDLKAGVSFLGSTPSAFLASDVMLADPKTGEVKKQASFPDNSVPTAENVPTLNQDAANVKTTVDESAQAKSSSSIPSNTQVSAWTPDKSQIVSENKATAFQSSFKSSDCTNGCIDMTKPNMMGYYFKPGSTEAVYTVITPDGVKREMTVEEVIRWKLDNSKELSDEQCDKFFIATNGGYTEDNDIRNPWSKLTYRDAQFYHCFDSPLYLYPTRATSVSISSGNAVYNTNPIDKNGHWNVTATVNGQLFSEGQIYNNIKYDYKGANLNPPKNGVVVESANLAKGLTEYAHNLKLNERETRDFVTFWQKKLKGLGPYIQISHYPLAEAEKILNLEISPKPDTFIPIVMYFRPLMAKINLPEPNFAEIPFRNGFTALDWSGRVDKNLP